MKGTITRYTAFVAHCKDVRLGCGVKARIARDLPLHQRP